ncbi:MAG: metallophosphoesterase [Verrucomicrobia bacterium]|nr:metallophosphoesterase [Verrucomicrobiota bacterium]MBV8640109.1 metallophosphoesterase [Verrucomicrobiota bacterium]
MRMLFVADLHYTLKQLDWLVANAGRYDLVIIGGDLLDLGSALDFDVQIVVVEKYLGRIRRNAPLLVSSGNHDGDKCNAANESFAEWLLMSRVEGLFVDGESAWLGDTRVTACPWWNGPVSRAELENLLARESAKSAGRWIWSHHEPPEGARVSWSGKKLLGDPFLLEWITRFEPDLVLSGHIHSAPFYPEGSWIDRIGKTWVFNPGRQPGSFPTYIDLDFDALVAAWISAEGESVRRLSLPDL